MKNFMTSDDLKLLKLRNYSAHEFAYAERPILAQIR